jgi:hypothetical protein
VKFVRCKVQYQEKLYEGWQARLNLSFRSEAEKSLRSLNNPEANGRKGALCVNTPRLVARQVASKGRLQGFLAVGLEMTGRVTFSILCIIFFGTLLLGMLVYDIQQLIARYEQRDVPEFGKRLYDHVSNTLFTDFLEHLNVLKKRLPDFH